MEGGGRNGREWAQAVSLSRVVCPWVCIGDGGKRLLRITQESLAELKRFDHSTALCVRLPPSYLSVSAIDTYVQLYNFLARKWPPSSALQGTATLAYATAAFFFIFLPSVCRSSGHASPKTVGAERRSSARKCTGIGGFGVPEPPLAARPEAAARGGESGPGWLRVRKVRYLP